MVDFELNRTITGISSRPGIAHYINEKTRNSVDVMSLDKASPKSAMISQYLPSPRETNKKELANAVSARKCRGGR